ncbi:MAG: protein kinase [Fimbriiglobus sp.]|jgi:serine/threonine protein kinase|nr:protein kinase [Fimbriiglobus sp.]
MATPVASVPEYCAAVGRSKLISEGDLREVRRRWTTEVKGSDSDVDAFRKFLVKERFLTEYQAALIQRGRAEGFVVADYVILERIGSGQSAGVYKAIHTSGQVVALKVLPGSKARDPNTLNRFQREGRLLTQLDHPNAVRAFQVGQAGGVHFIAMEHIEGETLDAVLDRRKRLPPAEAVRLIHQTLHGLQHLHDKRMVHRDLKPANLMLTPQPKADTLTSTVKVLDIGLGRELFDEASPATQDLHLTSEGALLGTPDYLAPEQARDARATDIRADIYSLGCVLYHLITGRPPFTDRNVMAMMVKHATASVTPVRELVPEVPAALSTVIDRLLAKKADDRPSTPAEAAELLAPFLPQKAQRAEPAAVLPAYQEWLESESAMEMPAEVVKATFTPAPVTASPVASKAMPLAARPLAAPMFVPSPTTEVNVELVTLPDPADREEDEEEERGLLDLDRRDWLMLGTGGFLMLLAIALGYTVTRLLGS